MLLKKNLRILILAAWDFAGCGYFLADAINKFTDSQARCIRLHNSTLNFPADIEAPSESELLDLWKQADVVHIHDDYPLPPMRQNKPVVITYHGSIYRASPGKYNQRDRDLGWLQTASTLDLTLLGPRWLPDCRPDMSKYIARSVQFSVCHAPTKRHIKGTDTVIRALKNHGIEYDIIEKVPWKDALIRKGRAWVTIDQFKLGYGCNAIEAWLMGQPVIGGSTDKAVLEKIRAVNSGDLPMIFTKEDESAIRGQVLALMSDKQLYDRYAMIGKDYAIHNHSQRAVAQIALNYYHEALESFYMPRSHPTPYQAKAVIPCPPGHTLIEYTGGNAGKETYIINGNRYKFSSVHPVQPVLDSDVTQLLETKKFVGRKNRKKTFVSLFRRYNNGQ